MSALCVPIYQTSYSKNLPVEISITDVTHIFESVDPSLYYYKVNVINYIQDKPVFCNAIKLHPCAPNITAFEQNIHAEIEDICAHLTQDTDPFYYEGAYYNKNSNLSTKLYGIAATSALCAMILENSYHKKYTYNGRLEPVRLACGLTAAATLFTCFIEDLLHKTQYNSYNQESTSAIQNLIKEKTRLLHHLKHDTFFTSMYVESLKVEYHEDVEYYYETEYTWDYALQQYFPIEIRRENVYGTYTDTPGENSFIFATKNPLLYAHYTISNDALYYRIELS